MPTELQRVHDKINYETNVVDPKTFAVLLNAVRTNQPLTYEKGRDDVFPKARSAAGMQWDPTKKDTHASGTLEQYGLVIPDENRTIKVSDLGYRFLACFDKDYNIVEEEDVYKTILLEMLFTWKESEHGRNIHPGRILFKLLLDKDLGFYTTNHEFAVWTSSEDSMSDRDYDKIKKMILDYRATPYDVAQKKAEVFLRPFANSWGIFDSDLNNGTYKFRIKDSMKPLVENFFIPKGERLKAESEKITKYILKNVEPKSSNAEYASVLKGLIARCGGDWDGARIFGVLYHEYVDGKQYGAICSLAGLKESSSTEFDKGKALGEYVVFRDLLIPVESGSVISPVEEADEDAEENALPIRSARTYRRYPLNLILYGAPGTGKTYSTIQLATSIVNKSTYSIDDICEGKVVIDRTDLMKEYTALVEKGLITFTTFHQSYGYEDFIQGLRPDDKSEMLRFVPVDGVFKRIASRAIMDQENNYVIIIDEINRANMSKVLGELITLLESDKRWGEINQLSTKLPSGQVFAVPNNLYVIGTMNSADKSISLIDAALRRRFEFVEVSVNYAAVTNGTAKKILERINDKLEKQLDSTDLLVGHAYFIGKDENTICDVMNHNVIPLLYEYFFDSKAKVKDVLKFALTDLPYSIKDEPGKRLKIAKN